MCGIAGFFSPTREVDRGVLTRMLDAIAHRGPDGRGTWFHHFGPVGPESAHAALGHQRLAIVDLSDDGNEPMSNEDGTLWLTYNGEIYNHAPLREELIRKGHRFRSRCDAEVLLHGFEEQGHSFFERIEGMYAFALVDVKARSIVLCRDMFGIKPLFHAWDGTTLGFGSELGTVEKGGFASELDVDAAALFLGLGYLPAPFSMLRGARKVPVGACLRFSSRGMEVLQVRTPPLPPSRRDTRPMTARDVEDTRRVLKECVQSHLMSDVEVGTFLSGGVDSSVVSAAMVELHGAPVRAFTIAVDDEDLDESEQAARAAIRFGVRHHVKRVTADEARARLPDILRSLDEPLADASILPTRLVSELAREHVKVVLSGDGGDELLGGYTRHHLTRILDRWRPLGFIAGQAAGILERTVGESAINAAYGRIGPLLGLPRMKAPARKLVAAAQSLSDARSLSYGRMFRTGLPRELEMLGVQPELTQTHLLDAARGYEQGDALSLGQVMDLRSWLPFDILTKVDRASMAVGLEARVPLVSSAFARHAASLPMDALRRGGDGKRVLRAIMADRFGEKLAGARKRGFGLPMQAWLAGPLRAWREDALGSFSTRKLVHAGSLRTLQDAHDAGDDHAPLLFALCALEMWLQGRGR